MRDSQVVQQRSKLALGYMVSAILDGNQRAQRFKGTLCAGSRHDA